MRHRRTGQSAPASAQPDLEQAWKTLALVNDMVKQAEAKLGVVLATTGVAVAILFNLVNGKTAVGDLPFDVAAAANAFFAAAAGTCAMIGLYPRINSRRRIASDPVNPLFFYDIACAFDGDPAGYEARLKALIASQYELTAHLAQQIHANAMVARAKYSWANRAVRALLLDLLALASLAAVIALRM